MPRPQKDLSFSVLLDQYGPALTDKQREILTEYYNEDFSLAEIAENFGITRQGVRDAIKHGEAALLDFLSKRLECRCENGGEERFRPDAARESVAAVLPKSLTEQTEFFAEYLSFNVLESILRGEMARRGVRFAADTTHWFTIAEREE